MSSQSTALHRSASDLNDNIYMTRMGSQSYRVRDAHLERTRLLTESNVN